ncbi:MAG: septum formation initiator family protein [Clostridiales bacterium]|nr:septum formation initiator family protein [Clostridiales bacterium]
MNNSRSSSNAFVKIGVVFFIGIILYTIISMQLRFNELREMRDALKREIEAGHARIEKLQNELEMPFDDEYVAKVARERLNLCRPEEILFYNDLLN